ncbi:hypothetical protein LOAG_12596, partial [Loa loa]
EENDEFCSSQWSSSSSPRASTVIPNTWFGSRTNIRPVSSNFDRSILSGVATEQAPNVTDYGEPLNSSLVNRNQNSDSKLLSSNQVTSTYLPSNSTILNRPGSKPVSTVPHPIIRPPFPPFSSLKPLLPSSSTSPLPQSREIWNGSSPPSSLSLSPTGTKVAPTITAGHLAFDIPGLPAIDSEDTDNNSQINLEILHKTPMNTGIIAHNLNSNCGNSST